MVTVQGGAQVIVRGKTYIQAVQKMQRALYEMQIRGVKTNIGFLQNVLKNPEFVSGMATTSLIDRNPQLISTSTSNQPDASKLLRYLGSLARSPLSPASVGLGECASCKLQAAIMTLHFRAPSLEHQAP